MPDRSASDDVPSGTERSLADPYRRPAAFEQDDALVAFVLERPSSVRLRNALVAASLGGQLPLRTLGEYLDCGVNAPAQMMSSIANLGRKSADELHALIHDVAGPTPPETARSRAEDIVAAAARLLGSLPTAEAIAGLDLPSRLHAGLAQLGYDRDGLSENVLQFGTRAVRLLALPNLGQTSIAAWRDGLGEAVRRSLARRGLGEDDARLVRDFFRGDDQAGEAEREALLRRICAGVAAPVADEPPAIPLATLVTTGLQGLDERERDVLERRFGCRGSSETLDDVGQSYGLTRERVRQIEAASLRKLRNRHLEALCRALTDSAEAIWDELSTDRLMTDGELASRRGRLSAVTRIALSAANMPLEVCLAMRARRHRDAWVSKEIDAIALEKAERVFAETLRDETLPCAVPLHDDALDQRIAGMLPRLSERPIFAGYVLQGPARRRTRRALRLHAMLAAEGGSSDVIALVERYRACFSGDPCSARDADIAMSAHPHLFVDVAEGLWQAIGRAAPPAPAPDNADAGLKDDPDEVEDSLEGTVRRTNANAIEAALKRCGPLRLSELMARADEFLPERRSANSIAPTMLAYKERFVRPLPGLYALPGQVPRPASLVAAPPNYLLDEDQARIFALARRAGEPWGSFPLWTPEMEYVWCSWASRYADPGLFESLLFVADVERWPGDDAVLAEWRSLVARRGRFCLAFAPSDDGLALPEPDRLLAAGLLALERGSIGWLSCNRVLQRRTVDHVAAGLLVALVAMDCLVPATDWQLPHRAGPQLASFVSRLARERGRGPLSWDEGLCRELLDGAKATPSTGGWVDRAAARRVLAGLSPAPLEAESVAVLLNDGRRRAGAGAFEATLATLLAPGRGSTP